MLLAYIYSFLELKIKEGKILHNLKVLPPYPIFGKGKILKDDA